MEDRNKKAEPNSHSDESQRAKRRIISLFLQLFLSLIIIGGSIGLAVHFMKTGPKAQPRVKKVNPIVVQIEQPKFSSQQMTIRAMGEVIPARDVTLTSRVGGEVITVDPVLIPGGFVQKGQHLITIDPIDYKLVVIQRASDVAKAESDLTLEMGNQRIAQKEFEILGEEATDDELELMLRQPQLEVKNAALKNAQVKLAQAELNLVRTQTNAPFNAIVLARSANLGSQVSVTTPLAHLAGTDEFWIRLSIPVEKLQWIKIPDHISTESSTVKIILREKGLQQTVRMGRVLSLAPDLEERGRLAILYVVIKDPLCRLPENRLHQKILIGSFVTAEIEGIELKSAIAIKRNYVRETDNLWLLDKQNKLAIRKIDIAAKNSEYVFITGGLSEDDRIITSSLSTPVPGTPLRLLSPEIMGKPSQEKTQPGQQRKSQPEAKN